MVDRVARIASIAAVVGLGAIGMALPDALLVGGVAWLALLFFVLSGWGWLVVRIARVEDPDFGLRATWGAAGFLAVAGLLLALGILNRPVLLVAITLGLAGFGWRELTTPEPLWQSALDAVAAARARPLLAYLAVILGAAVIIHITGSVARLDRNPWDDDIAYTPFVKRLLDSGDLIEPFSFRRLAAYGGHTVLQALVAARGNLSSVHALDQGLCFGLVILLLLGHARSVRTSGFVIALVILVVVFLFDISINTASYWSGAACFLALYRAVAGGNFMLAALLGAATCTLRQNYIPVVVMFLAFALLSQLQRAAAESGWREAWQTHRRTWLLACSLALVVLLPWCVAAFASNQTFLFPFMSGTWNAGLSLGPSGWTWVDELSLFLTTAIVSQPIVSMLVFAPLVLVALDVRPTRPSIAFFLASLLGLATLVHSFTDADSETMWRYAFGYTLTLFTVFVLEASGDGGEGTVRLPPIGRWLLIVVVIVQLVSSRTGQVKELLGTFADLREAAALGSHGDPSVHVERQRYAAMQATVPANARLLVMLDDPAFLDFSRNEIANIDTPGFASPGKQMPSFTGPEAMRAYLLDHGYRYVAFVKPDQSRYVFRRKFWVWRVFNDTEFFQAMSAYMIDTIETFEALAGTSKVLYDADGLVALDLERHHAPTRSLDPAHERERRDAFTRDLAKREQLEREWTLTTRRDVVFYDGWSGLTFAKADADTAWNEVVDVDPEPTHGVAIRWMYRRAHLRVRGDQDMRLVLRGRVSLDKTYTRPRLDTSIDGILLSSVTVDEKGAFEIDVVVPKEHLDGWSDIYVMSNAIGQPERDIRDLRLARLEEATWEPL